MGYFSDYTDETPEERRMRLLAEMGSPYLNPSPGADMGITPVGPAGMMPQGGLMAVGGNENRPELSMGTPWMDPGQTPDGSGRDYVDPPPRLGNFFRKPEEPQAPEQDGILFNGTRSPAGREVLAAETRPEAIPSGPIASPPGINVQGANNQDRSNAPKSPDQPKTASPVSLPTLAGALGTGAAGSYASMTPRVGAGPMAASPAPDPMAGAAAPNATATAAPASQSALPQPVAAAAAEGLSRKPGTPAAMNWLSENADLLIGLGAGLLSGKNIGEGIIAGLKMANDSKATSAKAKLEAEKNMAENLKKASSAALLQKAFGMSSDMALASADNADLVKRAGQIIYPDPKDPSWERTTLPNGQVILQNKETGDQKAAPGAEAEAPARPLTPQEKQTWGIPADDIRPYAITPGKAPTLIGGQQPFETPAQAAQKEEATGRTKGLVEQANKLAEGRMAAIQDRNMLEHVQGLMDNVNPGAVTSAANALRSRFGIAIDANAGKVQALQAAFEKLADNQRKTGTGPMTDADREAFLRMIPNLSGTREGNQIILDTMKGISDYNLKATELGAQWRQGKISATDLQGQLESIPNPMENFRRYQEAQKAPAAPGGSPAAAAPAPAAPNIIRFDRNGRRIQ